MNLGILVSTSLGAGIAPGADASRPPAQADAAGAALFTALLAALAEGPSGEAVVDDDAAPTETPSAAPGTSRAERDADEATSDLPAAAALTSLPPADLPHAPARPGHEPGRAASPSDEEAAAVNEASAGERAHAPREAERPGSPAPHTPAPVLRPAVELVTVVTEPVEAAATPAIEPADSTRQAPSSEPQPESAARSSAPVQDAPLPTARTNQQTAAPVDSAPANERTEQPAVPEIHTGRNVSREARPEPVRTDVPVDAPARATGERPVDAAPPDARVNRAPAATERPVDAPATDRPIDPAASRTGSTVPRAAAPVVIERGPQAAAAAPVDRFAAHAAPVDVSDAEAPADAVKAAASPHVADEAIARRSPVAAALAARLKQLAADDPESAEADAPAGRIVADIVHSALDEARQTSSHTGSSSTSSGGAFERHAPAMTTPAMQAMAPGASASSSSSSTAQAQAFARVLGEDAEPGQRQMTELVQSVRLLSTRGGGEMQIRLQPRHFGDLTLTVKVDGGQVITHVAADSAVVREWLESNHHLLRQGLTEQGLSLDRFEVREPQTSEHGRSSDERSAEEREAEDSPKRRQQDETGAVFEVVV